MVHLLRQLSRLAREFTYGTAASWLMSRQTVDRRKELEDIFAFVLTSELMGLPVIPAAYALKLLPYMVPQIYTWKRKQALWDDELESLMKYMHH